MARLPQPRFPRGPYPQQPQQVLPKPPRPRPRLRRRFRWEWLFVPMVLLIAAWLATGIQVGFSWDSVMDTLSVHNKEAYSRLAICGLIVVAVVAVMKILREQHEDRK